MKTIPLTQGKVALVDDEDFERFGHFKWYASWCPTNKSFIAKRTEHLPKQFTRLLHRDIMGVTDLRIQVDHKNHDTLDCQRHNLRLCNRSQNLSNRRGPQANSFSGIRGVSWKKDMGKWVAQIEVEGKKIHLGYFTDKTLAATVYAAANRQHFGEFGGHL